MFKGIILSILFLPLLLCMPSVSKADSIVYCDHPASLDYSPITSRLYLACAGSFNSLDLITIKPTTLAVERSFYIGGQLMAIEPVKGGSHLLLLLANVDGDTSISNGVLRKVNAATGEIVPGFEIEFDDVPLTMVADSAQTFLYVSWGLSKEQATINKIRISDFHVMPEFIEYGYSADLIALSNDDEKLYVNDETLHRSQQSSATFFKIGVINTNDMTVNCEVNIGRFLPYDMKMGYDNRLFISFPIPQEDLNDNNSLIVIDTDTDQIIEMISLDEDGIGEICIDPVNQKLYGTFCPRDFYDTDYDDYMHRPTDIIIQFDLNDPSYAPTFFEVNSESLMMIALAYSQSSVRLFARAATIDSPSIYYVDLK